MANLFSFQVFTKSLTHLDFTYYFGKCCVLVCNQNKSSTQAFSSEALDTVIEDNELLTFYLEDTTGEHIDQIAKSITTAAELSVRKLPGVSNLFALAAESTLHVANDDDN